MQNWNSTPEMHENRREQSLEKPPENILIHHRNHFVEMCGFGYEKKSENVLVQLTRKLVDNEDDRKAVITYVR